MAIKIEMVEAINSNYIRYPITWNKKRPSDSDWRYPVQDVDTLENRLLIARCEPDGTGKFYRSGDFGQFPDFAVLQRMLDSFKGDEPFIEEVIDIKPGEPHYDGPYNDLHSGLVAFSLTHYVEAQPVNQIEGPMLPFGHDIVGWLPHSRPAA